MLTFRGWAGYRRRRAACRAATLEVTQAQQARILQAWLDAVEHREVSELTAWAVRCFSRGKLGKAWRPWAADARLRVAARGAVQRWAGGKLGEALRHWRGVALQQRNQKLGALASGLHFEGAFTLKIFNAWRQQAKRQAIMRLLVGGSSRKSLLRRGFCAAREHATMAHMLQAGSLSAAGYSDVQLRRHAMIKWREVARNRGMLQDLFGQAASALMRTALQAWACGGAKCLAREQCGMQALAG